MKLINEIIRYESGELDANETLHLFSELIKTGQAWTLQGHYGRTAASLIENGWISSDGQLNKDKIEQVLN